MSFADYHYYEDLASDANYTPTANAMSTLWMEENEVGDNRLNVEFWDGGGWVETLGEPQATFKQYFIGGVPLNQDNAQNLRIKNDSVGPSKISLTGITWS